MQTKIPGCIVNEGFAKSCILTTGTDVGPRLYDIGMSVNWGLIFFYGPVVLVWTLLVRIIATITAWREA